MTGRKARGKLLDELSEITAWHRKHANKVLLATRRRKGRRGKRMKDMHPLWARHLDCPEEICVQLAGISAASIDRLLRGFKVTAGKKARPPKPASAVKALVAVRAQSWDTGETGWTELRAVWNRWQQASFDGLESIRESQPFDLLGVASDNGGGFLNYHPCAPPRRPALEPSRRTLRAKGAGDAMVS